MSRVAVVDLGHVFAVCGRNTRDCEVALQSERKYHTRRFGGGGRCILRWEKTNGDSAVVIFRIWISLAEQFKRSETQKQIAETFGWGIEGNFFRTNVDARSAAIGMRYQSADASSCMKRFYLNADAYEIARSRNERLTRSGERVANHKEVITIREGRRGGKFGSAS